MVTIFQAILCKDVALLESLLDPSKGSEYVLHLKTRDELGRTALYIACQHGCLPVVQKILDSGAANIEAADNKNWTPLTVASFYGHIEVVRALLELSAREDTAESLFGWTPLLASIWNGHIDVMRLLLSHNSSLSTKDKEGKSALILAAQRGHVEIVKLLVSEYKMDPNDTDKYGRSALYMAVQAGKLRVVKELVEAGVNIDLPDKDGRTPLYIATKTDNEDIAEYLASRGAVIDQTDTNKGAEVRPCSGNLIQKYDINPPVKVICFTEADGRLWGGCTDGSVLVWSLQHKKLLCYYQGAQKKAVHHMVAVDKHVWSLSGNKEIFVWKWNENSSDSSDARNKLILVTTLHQRQEINCIIRIKDEVWGGSMDSTLYVWNTKTFAAREQRIDTSPAMLEPYENFIACLHYKAHTLFVAVKNVILGYDIKTLQFQFVLDGHKDIITSILSFKETLWSAAKDDRIKVWDLKSRHAIKSFENVAGGEVNCMIYTGEDQILSGGRDGLIKSWCKKTNQWKRTFTPHHTRELACLFWDNRRNELWVGSLDKSVSVWR